MTDDVVNWDDPERLEAVPLFPLPNVVLFPNALLPLHIFEERYKAMTIDALRGKRQIAMALLSPGWEKSYYSQPPVETVVCVGSIVSHERLPDGKWNFLLRGEIRARIACEHASGSPDAGNLLYRTARLSRLPETRIMEIDLSHERERLQTLLTEGWLRKLPLVLQIASLLRTAMRTSDIADLLAFHLLDDVPLKQSILADGDVCGRVNRLLSALGTLESQTAEEFWYRTAGQAEPGQN